MPRVQRFMHLVRAEWSRFGTPGVFRQAIDRLLLRPWGLRVVRVFVLEAWVSHTTAADAPDDFRFLNAEEVARFASDPSNRIGSQFVARARGERDLCFGILRGGRLASSSWYALGSVEASHAAGVDLELPRDTAYLYKAFTHPDFRGARLYPNGMRAALAALRARGVDRLVAFVHWNDEAARRSCEQAGCRNLGPLWVGPTGALRVPPEARRIGLRFGSGASVERRGA